MPHVRTWAASQKLGRVFLSITFDGISKSGRLATEVANSIMHSIRTKDNVRNKKETASNIVLVSYQAQILVHPFNFCITQACTVDMGKEVEQGENRDQMAVNLCVWSAKEWDVGRAARHVYLSHNLLTPVSFIGT